MRKVSELSSDEIVIALKSSVVLVWAEPRDFPADHRLWIERLAEERSGFDAASSDSRKSEILFSRSAVPYLANQWRKLLGNEQLVFNISHTRDRYVAAFSVHGAIGVDLERVDREVSASVLERVASPPEQAWLTEQANPWERLKLWCLKEAAVKSHRGGMWLDGASWESSPPVLMARDQTVRRAGELYPARVELVDADWLLALVLAQPSQTIGVCPAFRWAE